MSLLEWIAGPQGRAHPDFSSSRPKSPCNRREAAMVSGFVGGVRDAQGLRGYVEVPAGEVVAIDLARGVALWRREKIGRPVAATARRLMTLDRAGERLVLRL